MTSVLLQFGDSLLFYRHLWHVAFQEKAARQRLNMPCDTAQIPRES